MQTEMASLPRFCAIHLFGFMMLAVIIVASTTRALAQDQLIASVASMEDVTAALGIEDVVVRADFQPASDVISLGYSTSAFWLRLRILPAPDGSDVVLVFGSASPDSLKLFAPLSASLNDDATGFDFMHHEEMSPDWPSALPGYRLSPPERGADYFVRIQSSGAVSLHMTALPVTEAIARTNRKYVAQNVYLTSMLIVMLWALYMFTISRQSIFGWFAALQFVWVGNNLFFLGYSESLLPFLSHETQILIFRSSVFLGAFLSVIFHRAVIIRFEPSWLALRLYNVQFGVIGFAFVSFWTFNKVLALQINAACLATMPIVFLIAALSARKNAEPGLISIRLVYGAVGLSFFFNAFTILGLIEAPLLIQYGYMIHGVVTSTLLVLLLNAQIRDTLATAHAAQIQRKELEKRNQIEQEKTHSLSQFIEMLGHEAKNALAVIQMSTPAHVLTDDQRARSDEAFRGLTSVLDRCNEVIRLDSQAHMVRLEACDLTETLQSLCATANNSARINLNVHGAVVVQADPVLLDVVFCNLLDNALKYAPPGSEICISLASEDGGHSVLFENSQGPAGMPDPERVFEKYYRSDCARAEIGSGLGLYIVRGLVGLMGGMIDYVPTENHIRFKVWFPC